MWWRITAVSEALLQLTLNQTHPFMYTGFRYRSVFQEVLLGLLAASSLSSMVVANPSVSPLEIRTTVGTVRGTSTSTGIDTWFGVPFAEPPVGNLRFKAPIPIRHPRSEVMDAINFAPLCPQPTSEVVDEDCLYLNVRSLVLLLKRLSYGQSPIKNRYGGRRMLVLERSYPSCSGFTEGGI